MDRKMEELFKNAWCQFSEKYKDQKICVENEAEARCWLFSFCVMQMKEEEYKQIRVEQITGRGFTDILLYENKDKSNQIIIEVKCLGEGADGILRILTANTPSRESSLMQLFNYMDGKKIEKGYLCVIKKKFPPSYDDIKQYTEWEESDKFKNKLVECVSMERKLKDYLIEKKIEPLFVSLPEVIQKHIK